MNKALCCVFILLFLLPVAGCDRNQADRDPILGSWETKTEMTILGVSVPDHGNQTVDAIYRIEFYEDGTGKSNTIVDEIYADYTRDMNASFTYTRDGDKLELTYENGNVQVFTVSFSGDNLLLDGRAHMELVRK